MFAVFLGLSSRDSVGEAKRLTENLREEAWRGVHDREMEEPEKFEVTVALAVDGTTGIQFSDTERPADGLRAAASALERLAVSIEREQEPVLCVTCGAAPVRARADPSGMWELLPCGHGLTAGL